MAEREVIPLGRNHSDLDRQTGLSADIEGKGFSGLLANLPEPEDDGEFQWCDDDVIVHHQPRTAVYWNPRGQIVIREAAADYGDDDPFVFVSVEHLPALISALQSRLNEAIGSDAPITVQRHVTPAALRQRRYRERHRNSGGTP